jgi:hypothetical protein
VKSVTPLRTVGFHIYCTIEKHDVLRRGQQRGLEDSLLSSDPSAVEVVSLWILDCANYGAVLELLFNDVCALSCPNTRSLLETATNIAHVCEACYQCHIQLCGSRHGS